MRLAMGRAPAVVARPRWAAASHAADAAAAYRTVDVTPGGCQLGSAAAEAVLPLYPSPTTIRRTGRLLATSVPEISSALLPGRRSRHGA
jgi:hypothetical protein